MPNQAGQIVQGSSFSPFVTQMAFICQNMSHAKYECQTGY